ncbi:MAG: rhamnulokinase [Bacteroidales bacterium]|nr:rhamnulokinase [Bacteroidales bacterium]
MKPNNKYLAIDLGAESGRVVIGFLVDNKIFLEEVHRFSTGMLFQNEHYYWNIYRFYEEILNALKICMTHLNINPDSMAIDTWGVDFGLLAEDGSLLRIPYAYRDPQSAEAMTEFLEKKLSTEKIYNLTGIAIQTYNSVYQLHALKRNVDFAINNASKLLFIPDLLNYFLTGEKKSEFTFATTSQLYNPKKGTWDTEILKAVDVPVTLMPEIVKPGTRIGMLKEDIVKLTGVKQFPVNAVCSHDTGSAIVAIPALGDDWAYISSGTWSLMGVEVPAPVISKKSRAYNFTNEGGAEGKFRFLKNIMGLWLLQECKKSWSKTGYGLDYSDLVDTAIDAKAFKCFIDPDNDNFFNPENMPAAIDEYCESTKQESPENVGEYVRTILEGLAFKYRLVLDQLAETTGRKINKIHIIGGGSKNEILCQFTANVTGVEVIAGPEEGTAVGNVLMQAIAMGEIDSVDEARKIVRNSFELKYFSPENKSEWESAYQEFLEIADLL